MGIIETDLENLTKMEWFKSTLTIPTGGKGLYPFTGMVTQKISDWSIMEGMCFLFLQHTSASLLIAENADPSAKLDIEVFFERLVPEAQPWMSHILEGDDDSSSHIRASVTSMDLSIPIENGQLSFGTWQGIYLFEHRSHRQQRQVVLRCLKIE
jgi:secondary thiamine-phosphate synthase enzyme